MFADRIVELWTVCFRSPRHPPARWQRLARGISAAADQWVNRSDADLSAAAMSLRYRALAGESLGQLLPDAFPLVIESARRHLGLRHFHEQILGGIALHHGCIAEIQTGEGKTLTATLPLFLNALSGRPVHLATANDYLAQRDAEWMRPVFESLGLTVGAVTGDLAPAQRRAAYACDITYGTAREFGFDFLRDRLAARSQPISATPLFAHSFGSASHSGEAAQSPATVQREPPYFALIDEADSLLIDEARTPLIISSQSTDSATTSALLQWCSHVANEFRDSELLAREPGSPEPTLTAAGVRRLRAVSKPATINDVPLSEIADALTRAVFVAETLQRDRHYVVRDGQVLIVDEYTGRVAEGRKWRNGVHQAVEARENVPLTPLTFHSAHVTVQEFFARYEHVCGMTGTAAFSAGEFWSVYGLPVVIVPTHRPCRRQTWPAQVLATAAARWSAIASEVGTLHREGRPVLIGTRTIEQSEQLSEHLRRLGLPHEVLNARNPAREAQIVANAGQPGCITVATNMAGRGTDIRLQADAEARGGLHVIGSELHASARIDRQLSGRCARQGDPGSTRQFLSLEDEILAEGLGEERRRELLSSAAGSEQSLSATAPRFREAQAAIERKHQQDRRLLVAHARQQTRQLLQLGQDPFLDAI